MKTALQSLHTSGSSMHRTVCLVREGISWWLNQLGQLCPPTVKHWLKPKQICCYLFVEADQYQFSTVPTGSPAEHIDLKQHVLPLSIRKRIRRMRRLVLVIPDEQVLRIPLKLPLAARDHLQRVLNGQMAIHTPFQADQVLFDYQIQHIDQDNEMLELEMQVVPKQWLQEHQQRLQNWSLSLTHLRPASMVASDDCNLLTESHILTRKPPLKRIAHALLTVNVLILALIIALPLWHKNRLIDRMEASKLLLKQEAEEVLLIRRQVERLQAFQEQLSSVSLEKRHTLSIVDELTRRLPDSAWVNRLELNDGKLQLQGEATNASSLISQLDGSILFSQVSFLAPVTRNPRSDKERYVINAELVKETE